MLTVFNPATGQALTELPTDTSDSILHKFTAAKEAQKKWARTPIEERIAVVRRFRDLVVQRKEALAKTLTSEVGKPITQSRNELTALSPRIDFFLERTAKAIADEIVLEDLPHQMEERIGHEPLGVIANISAWNYPYFVGSNVFVPALLTGNAVLYKPSEFSALTGLAIEKLFSDAGLPSGLFTALVGTGIIGEELLKLPINGVFFTGSYATGKKIAERAAPKVIKIQLELGGKDPIYVCEDVPIAAAVEATADGAFYNTGQSCCSVERIYVHEKIYTQFMDAFLNTVKGFRVGDPLKDETYIGPITRQAHLAYLETQVQDAARKGAKVLLGGKRIQSEGYFFESTVIGNVNHSMKVMKEETFGPLIGIQKVKDDAEAALWMNDSEYGLTSGVYTQDEKRATRILSQINSGTVYWNCCDRVSPRLPWTGRGHSGIGSTLSTYGIQAFVQPKDWHLRRSR